MIPIPLLLFLLFFSLSHFCFASSDAQQQLIEQIHAADQLYAKGLATGLSDAEYDALKLRLLTLSPDKMAFEAKQALVVKDKVALSQPMGSLNKSYSDKGVLDFIKRQGAAALIIQPKLDGVAVELIYQAGRLQQAASRGDGELGRNLLPLMRLMATLPKSLPAHQRQVLRGELIAIPSCYQQFKEQYSSPRQLAAALANTHIDRFEPALLSKIACLDFYPYHWLNAPDANDKQALVRLRLWGFADMARLTLPVTAESLVMQANKLRVRHNLPSDGTVIKVAERALRGNNGQHLATPDWALAWKNYSPEVITQVLAIDWQVGRTGKITPVIVIEPRVINKRRVSKLMGHSQAWLNKNGINQGALISISLKGEAIAQFKRVLTVASAPVGIPEALRAQRKISLCLTAMPPCEQRFIKQIAFSLKKLGIKGMQEQKIERWLALLGISHWQQLFKLSKAQWQALLHEQSEFAMAQLDGIIQQANTQQLLHILAPKGLGKIKQQALASHYPDYRQLATLTQDELKQVPGIGDKLALELQKLFRSLDL